MPKKLKRLSRFGSWPSFGPPNSQLFLKGLKDARDRVIRRVANTPIMKLAIMPTSRVKPKEKMEPVVDWPNIIERMLLGPKTIISMMATMAVVILPSKMAQKLLWKPFFKAPSRVLPLLSSSRTRLAVMTFASTPMPMERIRPAMPGRVMVKEFILGKNPDTAAKHMPICPARLMTATTPGSRKQTIISTAITRKAMTPAISMALSAWLPRVGARELKLEVSKAKGSAPAWIWAARVVASSLVKEPEITALPSVICSFTVG